MTLDNLLKIGQLKAHSTSRAEIEQLMHAAQQSLMDARQKNISAETRFDAAYRAVMQLALVALMAHGFRPDTKKPGHHVTMIQSLPKTVGLENDRMVLLDTLRHKRNLTDYTGACVDDAAVAACIEQGQRLTEEVRAWLEKNRPDLV